MQKTDILEMLKRVQTNGISISTETLDDYGLGGYDCPICGNTGKIVRQEDGMLISRDCECMPIRISLRRIRNSGMSDMLERYTLDGYQTPDDVRAKLKKQAQSFISSDKGWLFIAGRSGSGKTHICTAICSEFIKRSLEVYYMSWRDESVKLKSVVNDSDQYERMMRKLKSVKVLYIDDFFKGGEPTEADVRLAFEILNARYNDSTLRTIISSEKDMRAILSIDEALGGRIYERSRGYVLTAPNQNWRLR